MASFGLSSSSDAPQQQIQEAIEASTPWMAAADGKLQLLQTSLQTLQLPATAADENGYTLLQAAASYGQIPILQWILTQKNTNTTDVINAVDNEGDSALHYCGTLEAAKVLIEAGVAPGLTNNQGKTALQHKQEELRGLLEGDEEDSDSEDVESLKRQVEFLSTIPGA